MVGTLPRSACTSCTLPRHFGRHSCYSCPDRGHISTSPPSPVLTFLSSLFHTATPLLLRFYEFRRAFAIERGDPPVGRHVPLRSQESVSALGERDTSNVLLIAVIIIVLGYSNSFPLVFLRRVLNLAISSHKNLRATFNLTSPPKIPKKKNGERCYCPLALFNSKPEMPQGREYHLYSRFPCPTSSFVHPCY